MTAITAFEQRELRDVLGKFVTGVTVVTTRDAQGVAHGVTVNSFNSVSLDPPLVLWSQALGSKSFPAFRDGVHFTINILADDQAALSNHFARSREDKFAGIPHGDGLGGAPVLEGVAAHLECVKVAGHLNGDHMVWIGRVERLARSTRAALAFAEGRYVTVQAREASPSHVATQT